jgi:hypothetical protein
MPVLERDLDAHVEACEACQDFEADAVAIGRRLRLRAPRPVPDGLVETLVPLLGPSGTTLVTLPFTRRRPRGGSRRSRWARTAGWAGVMAPVVLAAVALAVGVGADPHLVPTRPPSPCTFALLERHVLRGG